MSCQIFPTPHKNIFKTLPYSSILLNYPLAPGWDYTASEVIKIKIKIKILICKIKNIRNFCRHVTNVWELSFSWYDENRKQERHYIYYNSSKAVDTTFIKTWMNLDEFLVEQSALEI